MSHEPEDTHEGGERRAHAQEIVVKEDRLLRVSVSILFMMVGLAAGAVWHSFRFGRLYESFIASEARDAQLQRETTDQLTRLANSVQGVKAELVAYINSQIEVASYGRWTQAHEEVAKQAEKEAFRENGQTAVAAAWPTVDQVNEKVRKYSIAHDAYKRSAPQPPN